MKLFTLMALTLLLVGCATSSDAVDRAIVYHAKAAPYVELGMSEDAFIALMEPAITPTEKERQPKRFSRGDDMYVVHFMRVAWVRDGLYTDDEYQPYTFANGKLVAVGWEYLGGEKYTTQDLKQRAASADKTNVDVRQTTTVNSGTSSTQCMPDLNGDGFCSGYRCC